MMRSYDVAGWTICVRWTGPIVWARRVAQGRYVGSWAGPEIDCGRGYGYLRILGLELSYSGEWGVP